MCWAHEDPPVWQSGLITVAPPVVVTLPLGALDLLKGLAAAVPVEFALFLAGHWQQGRLVVRDWYCPEQAVTATTVRILEEPPAGFTGVLHAHPPGCRSFSGIDQAYLNPNFGFSLLYLPPAEFPAAVVHLALPDGSRIRLPGRVVVATVEREAALSKIRREGGRFHAGRGIDDEPGDAVAATAAGRPGCIGGWSGGTGGRDPAVGSGAGDPGLYGGG